TEATPTAGALSNVLIGQVGLPAAAGQKLIGGISALPRAAAHPPYELQTPPPPPPGKGKQHPDPPPRRPSGGAPPRPPPGEGPLEAALRRPGRRKLREHARDRGARTVRARGAGRAGK